MGISSEFALPLRIDPHSFFFVFFFSFEFLFNQYTKRHGKLAQVSVTYGADLEVYLMSKTYCHRLNFCYKPVFRIALFGLGLISHYLFR